MANETGVIMKLRKEVAILSASIEVLSSEYKEREEKIKKLEFMIDNGLGWDDLKCGNIEDVR
ncbi:hypothetical protein VP381E491_P0024 [Vibrio phage 381E49-1]|nr:hypothetical protein VP381E491_P0024 [Vibrio phage 381E49-1]